MKSGDKIQKLKMPGRYTFNSIFNYIVASGTLVPRVKVIINNTILPEGVPITATTYTGGVNLFNYVGRSVAGNWESRSRTFTIEGFY